MPLTTQTHLGNHIFHGPYTANDQLATVSGVYIITTATANGQHTVIDVGESEDIKTRITNHDRTSQWRANAQNGLFAWILPSDEELRMTIEQAHRLAYQPVCGVR